jgi:hypothetical protein
LFKPYATGDLGITTDSVGNSWAVESNGNSVKYTLIGTNTVVTFPGHATDQQLCFFAGNVVSKPDVLTPISWKAQGFDFGPPPAAYSRYNPEPGWDYSEDGGRYGGGSSDYTVWK